MDIKEIVFGLIALLVLLALIFWFSAPSPIINPNEYQPESKIQLYGLKGQIQKISEGQFIILENNSVFSPQIRADLKAGNLIYVWSNQDPEQENQITAIKIHLLK